MSVLKNEIPILEYDSDTNAIIMPDHEKLNLKLPSKAVLGFWADLEAYADEHGWTVVGWFESSSRNIPIYLTQHNGQELCICHAPVGAAASVQLLDWLISYGVSEIIAFGCCGALIDLAENTFLVPTKALRDEGTSYHYLSPSRYVDLDSFMQSAIKMTLKDRNFSYQECVTWTTDAFFRETKKMVAYRRSEGCSVVEMECSALAACSRLRGALFGQLLYAGDILADANQYDHRNFGESSAEIALSICMEAIAGK